MFPADEELIGFPIKCEEKMWDEKKMIPKLNMIPLWF